MGPGPGFVHTQKRVMLDVSDVYIKYKVSFVVQCRYTTWQVQMKKNPGLPRPFINTFNYFIGVVTYYNFGSYL